jgi:predicted transcriptional regulator
MVGLEGRWCKKGFRVQGLGFREIAASQRLAKTAAEFKMSTAKEEVRQILDKLPDNATLEDIQYHLYVRQKIERAIEEADNGRVLSHEEVEKQMKKWLDE